ncbi:alpha/beta hydrolase [Microcoleus sp. FACHB-SPT15]|jgi:pimeloyl-ACP methyl ester carboxylesterase|uniref:alpha/beta fold hydrolase n=1 Tax=Microcoleus sp. FACHB-SPT15 TaxID=2692830 RepID=UPI0017840D85|nr:alpha/beta hydrolase [Microcoleus sp. FACHB-SPT15]MBD1806002.1 alpha/beta hydrolase [Microcoleus sp. FACHB-SPT15]
MPDVKSRPCFLTPVRINRNYPLFVFLPGMDGTGHLLRSQTQGLEKAFDVRCFAIPPNDSTNWEDLAEAVIHLIEAELVNTPSRSIYLCGESFGGCLAVKVALRSPELFDRIILINPATSFNQRPLLRWGSQLGRWVPDYFYEISAFALLPFLSALSRTSPNDRRALLEAMHSVPPKTVNWRLEMVTEFEIDETQLRQLTQPVLVIAGAADRLLPSVLEAERLASLLPNAKKVVLPESGHTCLLEINVNLFEILKSQNFLDDSVPNTDVDSALMPMVE